MSRQVNLSTETLDLLCGAVLYSLVALKHANQPPYEHVKLDQAAIDAHQEVYEMLLELTEPGEPPAAVPPTSDELGYSDDDAVTRGHSDD